MGAGRLKSNAMLMAAVLGLVYVGCSDNKQGPAPATSSSPAAAAKNTGPPTGWIDGFDGVPKVGGTLLLRGWAADPDDGAPVKKIEITIDDRVVALAGTINLPRPDVAAAGHRDDWLHSGWGAEVRMTGVFPGKHRLAAIAYDSAGAKAELQGAREIDVSAGQ